METPFCCRRRPPAVGGLLTDVLYNYIIVYMRYHFSALFLVAMTLGPRTTSAQRLTLREALTRAEGSAYGNRAARAQASAEGARALGALQGILPTLRVEGGWMETTDPLNAFGLLLRQRGVTAAAFDPTVLNGPAARRNWSGGVVAEIPLFNADALAGRSAAKSGARAAVDKATWTAATTRLQVINAYYGALRATEAARTLEVADAAATDHVRQATAMLDQGLVARSDLLLAQVRAGEVAAQLIGTRAQAALVRQQLAVVLGTPADTGFALVDTLPSADRIRAVAASLADGTAQDRADVTAASNAASAAGRDAWRAGGRLLPRVNAFGRYDWNDPSTPFAGQKSWTVGVMASWTPFSGFAEVADLRGTRARAAAARALAEATGANADLELASRESDVTVALARVSLAEQAVEQGTEAHRLVARRYAGGLAAITELLGAQSAETQTRLGLTDARMNAIIALAARELARGADPAAVAAVEE